MNADLGGADGTKPLHAAAISGHEGCLAVLLQAGADVNSVTKTRVTAVHHAARKGNSECLKKLLEAGADVNIDEEEGFLPLHYAAMDGEIQCIDLLLEAGADVNGRGTGLYSTPLMLAAHNGQHNCIVHLLEKGAHININNGLRFSALDVHLYSDNVKKHVTMLLYGAGEILIDQGFYPVPEYLRFTGERLELRHLCREAIRNHLLHLDPDHHLFNRIPELNLPSLLTEYLLFNVRLEYQGAEQGDEEQA